MTRGDRKTPGGNEFPTDAPSWALTEKTRSWVLKHPYGSGMVERHGDRDGTPVDQPAPAITSTARPREWHWSFIEPATTVCGDPRIGGRAHHHHGQQMANPLTPADILAGETDRTRPIRLELTDALILQSFPPNYPVQGTRTKQFEQVGNAVPPTLARHVLAQFCADAAQ